jgi:1-phosphatidylinositol-3-phosphate 5-kinase
LTPVVSESPSYIPEVEVTSRAYAHHQKHAHTHSLTDADVAYGTTIPGFPIPDDVRSVRTVGSLKRTESVSKIIRRLRGEGK